MISSCTDYRAQILGHLAHNSQYLSADAKAHIADCEACLAAAVEFLDQQVAERVRGGTAPGATTAAPEQAQRALTHGRDVLKREFGLSID